jgi:serine/threonine protein kinase
MRGEILGMNAPLLPALPGYDNPELIAHGTTALVFRAIQTTLNRPVAIKVITVDTGSVPVNAARELATTVALSSQPHIVSIIDTGVTQDDRPYIVMEYCEGGSYAAILRHDGPLPVADVLEVGVKIGEALHAAHQVGIVHRDVKPSNILIAPGDKATLTDFGFVSISDGSKLTMSGAWIGTPHYMAPEQLSAKATVDGRVDVWGLGVSLYEALTGQVPFQAPNLHAIFARILMTEPDRAPLLAAGGDELAKVVLRFLEKDSTKRPTPEDAEKLLLPWKK